MQELLDLILSDWKIGLTIIVIIVIALVYGGSVEPGCGGYKCS